MVTCPLVVGRHPRRSLPFSPIPCSPNPLSSNSFPLISFADPHHLNPVASHLYKNHRGEGVPPAFSVSTPKSLTPVSAKLPQKPLLSPVIATDPKTPSRKSLSLPQIRDPRAPLPLRNHHATKRCLLYHPSAQALGSGGIYEKAPQLGVMREP